MMYPITYSEELCLKAADFIRTEEGKAPASVRRVILNCTEDTARVLEVRKLSMSF
jgi:hypothetical protein